MVRDLIFQKRYVVNIYTNKIVISVQNAVYSTLSSDLSLTCVLYSLCYVSLVRVAGPSLTENGLGQSLKLSRSVYNSSVRVTSA